MARRLFVSAAILGAAAAYLTIRRDLKALRERPVAVPPTPVDAVVDPRLASRERASASEATPDPTPVTPDPTPVTPDPTPVTAAPTRVAPAGPELPERAAATATLESAATIIPVEPVATPEAPAEPRAGDAEEIESAPPDQDAVAAERDAAGAKGADGSDDADPPDPEPIERGRFSLGGWAAEAGHAVISGITFLKRLPGPPPLDRIRIRIARADNADESHVVVLSEPGFAPDHDGFSLLVAAQGPGPFAVSGTYELLPA